VMYREMWNVTKDGLQPENIRLQQHSASGPWLALGLGTILAVLLMYLLYANVLFPPAPPASLEHSMRVLNDAPSLGIAWRAPQPSSATAPAPPSKKAAAQLRTPHALLGGQGPASPPRYTRDLSPPPQVGNAQP